MAIGLSASKADIDAQAGNTALTVREAFRTVQVFQAWLAATPDANLVALGYTAGEVATLKSAFTDLDKLRTIYEGTATQTPAYDFRTFAKLLVGVR